MAQYVLTEEDVKNRLITPVLEAKNWDREQMYMEYAFTAGRINVFGKQAQRNKGSIKKVDYLLTTKANDMQIAIIEAKAQSFSVSSGIQQALNYAELLDVPFVYSSNGEGFLEHDMLTGNVREGRLEGVQFGKKTTVYVSKTIFID